MGKTILLANDDVAYATQLEQQLTKQGFLVSYHDETTKPVTTKQSPAAIVVDFETINTERLSSLQNLQNTDRAGVPVIILTKYPNPSHVQRIAQYLPPRTCVTKAEYSPHSIADLISQHCDEYHTTAT